MKKILLIITLLSFSCSSYAGLVRVPKEEVNSKIDIIEKQVEQLSKIIQEKQCQSVPNTDNKEIKELKANLNSLKKFILDSPEAAVAITLVKSDVEFLKKENTLLRQEIVNISDMGKWFVGLLITIILGVFGLLIPLVMANSSQNKEKGKSKKQK